MISVEEVDIYCCVEQMTRLSCKYYKNEFANIYCLSLNLVIFLSHKSFHLYASLSALIYLSTFLRIYCVYQTELFGSHIFYKHWMHIRAQRESFALLHWRFPCFIATMENQLFNDHKCSFSDTQDKKVHNLVLVVKSWLETQI